MTFSPLILAIDSAMNGCSAALYREDGKISCARSKDMMRGQSEALVPMIDEIVTEAGVTYADIDQIVVTRGPGAFTGLRIGLSCAKAMAMALDIPVTGLTTLEVLAAQFQAQEKTPCAVLVETKRSDYYFQLFDADGTAMGKPAALDGAQVSAAIKPHQVTLIGDAVERFTQEIGHNHKGVTIALPDPLIMCRLAAAGRGLEDTAPLYLRGPDVSTPKNPPRVLAEANKN